MLSFSVAIALSKTEPVQVAVFGLVLLGDRLTAVGAAGIAIATAGVIAVAVRPGERWSARTVRPALLGVASGALFALSAVGFRGGILALGEAQFVLRATTTLVWSLGVQSALLVVWRIGILKPLFCAGGGARKKNCVNAADGSRWPSHFAASLGVQFRCIRGTDRTRRAQRA